MLNGEFPLRSGVECHYGALIIPNGSTVQARLSNSYLLLGGDAEEFMRRASVADNLIVRFDGQGLESDAAVLVRTANAENAVPGMQACMRALQAQ